MEEPESKRQKLQEGAVTAAAADAEALAPTDTTAHLPDAAPQPGAAPPIPQSAAAAAAPQAAPSIAATPTAAAAAAAAAVPIPPLPPAAAAQQPPLRYGVSEDKGCRPTMEDVAVCRVDARHDTSSSLRVSFFAVLDGHGGRQCAEYAAEQLHARVMAAGLVPPAVASGEQVVDIKASKQAIMQGFKDLDLELLELCQKHNWQDGAAAVAVWLVGDVVLVANVGDAKCVLARTPEQQGGGAARAITLTKDHLAIYPAERARIERAGGRVTKEGRLNGRIQISRSLGDAAFKGSGASAVPDVAAFRITPRDQFLLCGCDGFWGVFDPQGAVDCAAAAITGGKEGKGVTSRLLKEAVRERRCKDNCTILLVHLQHSPSKGDNPLQQPL